MERDDILAKVQEVFRDELEVEDLVLTDETTADDVEEWDSLSHVQLVVALEKAFGIKFTSREILSWDNVGDLVDCIAGKM
ncbi:acyl carrier protein [Prevotella sp. tf2-5]|uniref:acyl carrier protein n=1 Tax=Prevotella sp. tf2-5 TaxID=1761889 RepID=UPI0008EE44C9|nr:acyl carrier protein [Prevotella sp. tf2-5]SFO52991.1 acyl carrier protein [Prevotella sp. tf2-5]